MTYEEFKQRLKTLNLSVGDFAELIGRSMQSVSNWRMEEGVPSWVPPFLDALEDSQKLKKLTDLLK